MQIVATIGVLVFRNNNLEILLVKHREEAGHPTGIYGIPSGRVEDGESDIEAAKRELEEETGLKTSIKDLLELPFDFGVTKLKRKNGTMFCTWKVFVCKNFSGELKSSKETVPEWVKVADLNKYWLLPSIKQAAAEGLKFLAQN